MVKAVSEAVSANLQHLFQMDGLGVFSAMAEAIAKETDPEARALGLTEDEHEGYVARALIHEMN